MRNRSRYNFTLVGSACIGGLVALAWFAWSLATPNAAERLRRGESPEIAIAVPAASQPQPMRTAVSTEPNSATAPGISGTVRFADGRTGTTTLRIVGGTGTLLHRAEVSVPGPLSIPTWTDAEDVVQAVFWGRDGHGTFWCRRGESAREFVLDVVKPGSITWLLPENLRRPVVRASLYAIADITGEDKDATVAAHWNAVAVAAGLQTAATVNTELGPETETGAGTRYLLRDVPPGPYLILLRMVGADGAEAVWATQVTTDASLLDLGMLTPAAERLAIMVRDAASGAPVQSLGRLTLGRWQTEFAVVGDAAGTMSLPILNGVEWTIAAPGYIAKRLVWSQGTTTGEVQLERATDHELQAAPGTMWFALEAGRWIGARAGADGKAKLSTRTKNLSDIELVAYAPTEGRYTVTKGRLDASAATACRLTATTGGRPLDHGSVTAAAADVGYAMTTSIRDGVGTVRIPRGSVRFTIRVGQQVHDNDHEYYFTRDVDDRSDPLHFDLPGGTLRLAVLDPQDRPADGRWITASTRGEDPIGGYTWRIRSSGQVRGGVIEFAALPNTPIAVLLGRRELARLPPSPRLLTLNLP